MKKKTILVIGATGQQGGSVVRYLLRDGTFRVRAMSRRPLSELTKHLPSMVDEVVSGDLNDVESLTSAMRGCYGVFGVTNYFDSSGGYDSEVRHARHIGMACQRAGVRHLVFSTLDRDTQVPHFQSKVEGEDFIRSLGVPTTWLVTSFYFENFLKYFHPEISERDGSVLFRFPQRPTTRVPMFACSDTGGWVLAAFKDPARFLGRDVAAVSQYLTYPELTEIVEQVSGRKCQFEEIPLATFRKINEEMYQNMLFFDLASEGKVKDRRRGVNVEPVESFKGDTWEQYLIRERPPYARKVASL